jgi:hypothetical protein
MIRIWLTDYDFNPETGWGSMCGPDIIAPSESIAKQMAKAIARNNPKMRDLRILGWKVGEVQANKNTFEVDWNTYIDLENIWMN